MKAVMEIKEVRNENGELSGLLIPAESIGELMESVKSDSSVFEYLNTLLTTHNDRDNQLQRVVDRTLPEIEAASRKVIEQTYRTAFAKGAPLFYQDERTKGPAEFVRANPDGSEDLVSYQFHNRSYDLLRKLKGKGQGYWSYLITNQ